MSLRILISYWYFKDHDVEELLAKKLPGVDVDLIADSGAYSAHTQGSDLDVEDYIRWLKRWEHRFTAYFNLDVLYDPEKTWANQQRIEDVGLRPVPVFHSIEDWSWLDHYVERYSLVGLGGVAMIRPETRMAWLVKAFRQAQGQAVFHGLGIYDVDAVAGLPFYSVDSSSWTSVVQFGSAKLFDPRSGKRVLIRLGDHKGVYRHAELLRRYGFDPADFADRARNKRTTCLALTLTSVMQMEEWMRKRHGPIVLPERDGIRGPRVARPVGPRLFSSDAGANGGKDFPLALEGLAETVGPRVYAGGDNDGSDFGDGIRGLTGPRAYSASSDINDFPAAAAGVGEAAGPKHYVVSSADQLAQPRGAVDGLDNQGPRTYMVDSGFARFIEPGEAVKGLGDLPRGPRVYAAEAFMKLRQFEEAVEGLDEAGITDRWINQEGSA